MTSMRGMVTPFRVLLSQEIGQEVNVSQLIWYLLKDPSRPLPFLMPSKLMILHGEGKS